MDDVQANKASNQDGQIELPDDAFDDGKPASRPGQRNNIPVSDKAIGCQLSAISQAIIVDS
jgi:hypothetical protein